LPIRVPGRRTTAICLAYAAIGFTPIAALALTIGGLWSLTVGSLILIAPAVVAAIVLGVLFPRHGRYAVEGLAAGLAAVLVYDVMRWTFVGLGWWGDFIPNIGGWLNGTGQPDWLLGYGFRWLGDGGGMGLTFMVAARTFAPGLARRASLVLGIAYGLAIWLCLIIILLVSPEGQAMLFPLTAVTLLLSWIGHVVFGAALGGMLGRTGMRPGRMPGYATGESGRKNATRSARSCRVTPAVRIREAQCSGRSPGAYPPGRPQTGAMGGPERPSP
jgi:hypothetical protein